MEALDGRTPSTAVLSVPHERSLWTRVIASESRKGTVNLLGVIAHPGCATVSLIDAVARALRRSPRTERPLTLAVLTTERKAA